MVNITQKVDIWSIGAVFSEAAVWVVDGYEALEQYRQLRQEATKAIPGFEDGNCFHDGEQMLEIVRTQHRNLEECLRSHDTITSAVLAMIEDMLVDANSRPNANHFWKRSQRILKNAWDKLENLAIRGQQTSTTGRERRRPLVEPSGLGAEPSIIPDREGQDMSWYGHGTTSKELCTPDKSNPPRRGLHDSRTAGVPKSYTSPSPGRQLTTRVKSRRVQKASQVVPPSDTRETDLDQYQTPTPSSSQKMDTPSLTQHDLDSSDDTGCYDYDDPKEDEVLQDTISSDKRYRASAPSPHSKYASVDLSKPKYRSEPPDLTGQVGRRKTDLSSQVIHSERDLMPPSKAATSYIPNGLTTQMKDISKEGSRIITHTAPSGPTPSSPTFQTPIESSSEAPVPSPHEKERRKPSDNPKLSRNDAVRWKDEKKQGRQYILHGDWLFHRLNQRDNVS